MVAEGLPAQLACRVLDVSESGFYAWRSRPPSARAIRHAWLTDLIRQVHVDFRGVYGYRRRRQIRLISLLQLRRSTSLSVLTAEARAVSDASAVPVDLFAADGMSDARRAADGMSDARRAADGMSDARRVADPHGVNVARW